MEKNKGGVSYVVDGHLMTFYLPSSGKKGQRSSNMMCYLCPDFVLYIYCSFPVIASGGGGGGRRGGGVVFVFF